MSNLKIVDKDGIYSIGVLLRKIRETYIPDMKEFCAVAGISEKYSDISRFETNQKSTIDDNVAISYLKGLGLSPEERDFLLNKLFYPSKRASIRENEDMLLMMSFSLISDYKNDEIAEMIRDLEKQIYPACICDNLWFTPAFNSNLVVLFDIEEDLKKWETWHAIARNISKQSKFSKSHDESLIPFLPRLIKGFFENTAPLFFTTHMRVLRNRFWDISPGYRDIWRSVVTFREKCKYSGKMLRIVNSDSQRSMITVARQIRRYKIDIGDLYRVHYRMIVLEPNDIRSEHEFNRIAETTKPEIYFASKYIQDYNDWPEIKAAFSDR